jgi:hypothetical protein
MFTIFLFMFSGFGGGAAPSPWTPVAPAPGVWTPVAPAPGVWTPL